MPRIKMMKCKDCGADISKRADACPQCGRKIRGGAGRGCLAAVLVIIGAVLIASWAIGGSANKNNEAEASLMTMEKFNSIQTGMLYDEVLEIVGVDGELMSESDIGQGAQYKTQLFTWEGNGGLGSNANITFQGGRVIAKAQLGLK